MEPITILLLSLNMLLLIVLTVLTVSLRRDKRGGMQSAEGKLTELDNHLTRIDSQVRDEFERNRRELAHSFGVVSSALDSSLKQAIEMLTNSQTSQFNMFSSRQESLRAVIDVQLKEIRTETAKQLDDMRKTVDEHLKDTVEKRFNESFKMISERLEQVHRGLGEMQQLASGVGDLKRVLTNVKTKGNLGEIQLGAILEQILAPGQYEAQAQVKQNSQERVDYVIRLPDKNSADTVLLLPIDSKFPTEDYTRLLDAYDAGIGDEEVKRASGAFENAVRKCAKEISAKYINPPVTTDFAIMFVPTEGLYAEIIRRTSLFETVQREYRVTIVGPTNLSAFLSSLQMGFRTLAIERRSNEVWQLLGAVKTEFGKFGNVMDKIKKSIDEAAKQIDTVGTRSRQIERKLRTVEALPEMETITFLGSDADFAGADNSEEI
ncbi:MAG: DNA recombination protein RmuC [Oscillospiraceae bacterium]|jgi:DNA recombination protein RmuC|nr:DNA recombination protein RmuC [Oscillospiraceae bacterium]